MSDNGRESPDSSGPSLKRSRVDSVSEDGPGRSGSGTAAGGGGSGSAVLGNASGNWIGGAQFGSHGVTTRMSRNFSLPIYDGGNYKRIRGNSSSTFTVDRWSGYSTPWGYLDFNRWDLHFSPRAWQKLVNNYRGIRPKTMQVRICNIQVREAIYSGDQTIYNSSPNGSIMAVVDYDGKYPYVLGNMQWGQLAVAPYKVTQLPQYGYTFSGCGDSTGFYCLEGGNCQVLRTGDTVEFTFQFKDVPMLDLCIVAQQANQMANPLLGSYMLRAYGLEKDNVSVISDTRFINAGDYSIMYHNFLFGNLWQHSLYNGSLVQSCDDTRVRVCKEVPLDGGEVEFPVGDFIIGDPRSGDGNEIIDDGDEGGENPGNPGEGGSGLGGHVRFQRKPVLMSRDLPINDSEDTDDVEFPVTRLTCTVAKNAFNNEIRKNIKKHGVGIKFRRILDPVMPGVKPESFTVEVDTNSSNVYNESQSEVVEGTRTGFNHTRVNTLAHAPSTTWYKAVSYTTLKDGTASSTSATFDTIMDGPHGQSWVVDQNGIAGHPMIPASYKEGDTIPWRHQNNVTLTDDDWNVSCNPLAGAQSGTSVSQTVRDVLKERAVNVRGIFPGTCWQDKDIWYSGPIWCKIPDISSFHPKPLFGGYGLRSPPPQIFLKNNPIFLPGNPAGGANYISNSYVNQLSSGQVSVEIEWECVPDQGVAWGPEDAQTVENFGGPDKYCPDGNGHFVVGANSQSRTLRKHL